MCFELLDCFEQSNINDFQFSEEVAIKKNFIMLSRKDCTKAFTLLTKRLRP